MAKGNPTSIKFLLVGLAFKRRGLLKLTEDGKRKIIVEHLKWLFNLKFIHFAIYLSISI